MRRIETRVSSPLFVIAVSLFAASLNANQQVLLVEPASIVMDVGAAESELTVSYDTVPDGLQTAGVGISVFFDSAKLRLESLVPTYQEGLVQATGTMGSVVDEKPDCIRLEIMSDNDYFFQYVFE